MLSQKDEFINDASSTVYQLSQEEKIRLQCEAREDYYRRQNYVEEELSSKNTIIAEKDAVIAEKDIIIAEKDAAIAEKDAYIAEKDAVIAEKDAYISALMAELAHFQKE